MRCRSVKFVFYSVTLMTVLPSEVADRFYKEFMYDICQNEFAISLPLFYFR